MCCQIRFITDSQQYLFIFFFYKLPRPWPEACGKRIDPFIRWSQTPLRKLLTHLGVNPPHALNGPFNGLPENFRKTRECSLWDVPFLWLQLVSFGHRSAFLAHSFTGHSFCLSLPNTCLSASLWNSIFSDIDWIFMHIFFPLQVVFESQSQASLFNHVSVKNLSTYFSDTASLSFFFKSSFLLRVPLHSQLLSARLLFFLYI